jgi:hypothetical protein
VNAIDPVITFAFLGVGLFGLGFAFMLARRPIHLLRAGGRAEGTVTGNNEQVISSSKGPTRTYYFPEIDYTTAKGEAISFISRSGRVKPEAIGTRCPLIYDPAQPREVLVRAFGNLWLFPMLLVIFTSPFLAVGIVGLAQHL